MRPYEVMVIFDTGAEPPAIQAVVDRILESVRATGGTPGAVDRWGRRPFAYEVKHRREGYYVLVEFASEVQTVHELDRTLTLADEVLRHKVIRLPEKATKRSTTGTPADGRPADPAPKPAATTEPAVPTPGVPADAEGAESAAPAESEQGESGEPEPSEPSGDDPSEPVAAETADQGAG
jgi:small subunit ribosomal protein S6